MQQLYSDIALFEYHCRLNGIQGYVRLNGTSDIDWQKLKINSKNIIESFPLLKFYDYTKDLKRSSNFSNYDLTYSRSEVTKLPSIQSLINSGKNVAVVFNKLPETWNGHKVINGDLNDLRFEDEKGVIVGLVSKGAAKKDSSGFVINTINIHNI